MNRGIPVDPPRQRPTPLQEGPGKVPGFLLGGDDPTVGNPVEDTEGEERSADTLVDAEDDDPGAGLLRAVDDLGRQVSGATQGPSPGMSATTMIRQTMPATTVFPPKRRAVMVAMVPLPGITPTTPAARFPRPRPNLNRVKALFLGGQERFTLSGGGGAGSTLPSPGGRGLQLPPA